MQINGWNSRIETYLCRFVTHFNAARVQGCPLRGTNGALAGREVARLPTSHAHVPDGMAIDANGNLWVAMGESSKIVCYSAATGEALQEVTLPVKRPTSCIFGGPGLEEMYVVTRVESGDAASEHHGGIFRVKIPGVRGLAPEPYYHL